MAYQSIVVRGATLEREYCYLLSRFPQIVRHYRYLFGNCERSDQRLSGKHQEHNIFVCRKGIERLERIQDSVERNFCLFRLRITRVAALRDHGGNFREIAGK